MEDYRNISSQQEPSTTIFYGGWGSPVSVVIILLNPPLVENLALNKGGFNNYLDQLLE